ncbi:hypothetical protein [Loigolactobacillus jiayinensis]|uniref:Uncharacterized protein n=1 Tax=Loigolactobacillus jiayinensis TaxID=2486016 RepID=A0ABW1RDS2_9LACO|nr:hypothetical protein [Loigolactobacillus jiayinensis]
MLKDIEIIVVALFTPILLGQASVLWINRQTKNSPLLHAEKGKAHTVVKDTH